MHAQQSTVKQSVLPVIIIQSVCLKVHTDTECSIMRDIDYQLFTLTGCPCPYIIVMDTLQQLHLLKHSTRMLEAMYCFSIL